MKFEKAKKAHRVVLEVVIVTTDAPDDAGFDLVKSKAGEFARMRVVSKEEIPVGDARRLVKDMGGDLEVFDGEEEEKPFEEGL